MKKLILIAALLASSSSWGACISGNCTNGIGTFTFASGSKYVGEYQDGKKHGQGTFTWANGDKYVGEFKDGNMHGQGTSTSVNGDKYVGEWKHSNMHGQGTYTYTSGNKYIGEFQDGKVHGQGTYTWADGEKYAGKWKHSNMHGQGTHTWADGEKYVGEHQDGKRHGQGTHTFTSGSKYVGEFQDDNMHGQGTLTSANGDKYVGEWKDGKRHGQGTSTSVNGDKYVGEWKDGKRHGQDTLTFPIGDKYVGEYQDGEKHENDFTEDKLTLKGLDQGYLYYDEISHLSDEFLEKLEDLDIHIYKNEPNNQHTDTEGKTSLVCNMKVSGGKKRRNVLDRYDRKIGSIDQEDDGNYKITIKIDGSKAILNIDPRLLPPVNDGSKITGRVTETEDEFIIWYSQNFADNTKMTIDRYSGSAELRSQSFDGWGEIISGLIDIYEGTTSKKTKISGLCEGGSERKF